MVPAFLKIFAENAVSTLQTDPNLVGLATAGSWLTGELDEFSDVDLILVSEEKIAPDAARMRAYADRLGTVLAAFTGEHVGEPRLLICLYDQPLLHVDIKFLTPDELHDRVENPAVLWERDGRLTEILRASDGRWPYPDYQWLEDRFWVWVHYATQKIGRGEYVEALDFLSFLRTSVLGPLLHIRREKLPRGVRKLEFVLSPTELRDLHETVARPERGDLVQALDACVRLYLALRHDVFPADIRPNEAARRAVEAYSERLFA